MKMLQLNRIIVATSTVFVSVFASCKKQDALVVEPAIVYGNIQDSASYTINGKLYVCDNANFFGRGNAQANRDSVTGRWDADTLVYYSEFGLSKKPDEDRSNDGELHVSIIKKYSKSQLIAASNMPSILQPKNIIAHYTPGKYPFALDFERNNRLNGVKLLIRKVNGNEAEYLSTQMLFSNAADYQNNAAFEIIQFEPAGNDGSYLLTAKFSANAYNANGTATRVENGYIRYRLR